MSVRATYAGQVQEGVLHLKGKDANETAAIITNMEPAPPGDGPTWTLPLTIGEGPSARVVDIQIAPITSKADYELSNSEPVFVLHGAAERLVLFRDKLFRIENGQLRSSVLTERDRDEVTLRVKKAVYSEEEELNSIKSYVANVEAAREYQKTGPKRDPIPSDAKMLVWSRDGGACTSCGAKEKLHFDHIIPVAKGGGSTAENIQILCETCNLKKSDKIA